MNLVGGEALIKVINDPSLLWFGIDLHEGPGTVLFSLLTEHAEFTRHTNNS